MSKKNVSSERPKKETDKYSEKEKELFRYAKWLYYMNKSKERAKKSTIERNSKRPEFASKEAVDLFEGQIQAYKSSLEMLIEMLSLPSVEKILDMKL